MLSQTCHKAHCGSLEACGTCAKVCAGLLALVRDSGAGLCGPSGGGGGEWNRGMRGVMGKGGVDQSQEEMGMVVEVSTISCLSFQV